MRGLGLILIILLVSEFTSILILGTQKTLILSHPSSNHVAWSTSWGGVLRDYSYDAVLTSGSLFVTGATYSYGPGPVNLVLLKYSGEGVLAWNKTYSLGGYTMGRGAASDGDSIYVSGIHILGNVSYSLLMKYNQEGRLIWEREWRPRIDAKSTDVSLDEAGNIYVTGYVVDSPQLNSEYLLKYSGGGDLLYSKIVDSQNSETAWGISVSDAVYLCGEAGYNTSSPRPVTSMLLTKMSLDGTVLWSRETSIGVGNAANAVDAKDVISVAGYAMFMNGTAKEVLRQYSPNGDLVYTLVLGESPIEDMAWGVVSAGQYIYVVGHARPNFTDMADATVCKIGPDGRLIWRDYYGGTNIDRARAVSVSGNEVYVVGETMMYGLDMQISVKKYVSPNAALNPELSLSLQLSPMAIGCLLFMVQISDLMRRRMR